jgi:hypothetical protein
MVCETEISGAGEAPFPIMKGKKERRGEAVKDYAQ